ncbi:MAG: hypothetical protein ACD_82C00061G0002 [uncultured bacterium]|nr:MAG: hypothetical protein ACD_82C00061G0002 [uncultured bacterium]
MPSIASLTPYFVTYSKISEASKLIKLILFLFPGISFSSFAISPARASAMNDFPVPGFPANK